MYVFSLVGQILRERNPDVKIQYTAVAGLYVAADGFLTHLFEEANLRAIRDLRKTVTDEDVRALTSRLTTLR